MALYFSRQIIFKDILQELNSPINIIQEYM